MINNWRQYSKPEINMDLTYEYIKIKIIDYKANQVKQRGAG